jgi:hypothetical protein
MSQQMPAKNPSHKESDMEVDEPNAPAVPGQALDVIEAARRQEQLDRDASEARKLEAIANQERANELVREEERKRLAREAETAEARKLEAIADQECANQLAEEEQRMRLATEAETAELLRLAELRAAMGNDDLRVDTLTPPPDEPPTEPHNFTNNMRDRLPLSKLGEQMSILFICFIHNKVSDHTQGHLLKNDGGNVR